MPHVVNATHRVFDRSLAPVLSVQPGETVEFDCPTAFAWGADATVDDIARLGPYPHILAGPVSVVGAEPGDALVIDILDVSLTADYGITAFFGSRFGLLPQDFPEPHLQAIRYVGGMGILKPGVKVPLEPFLGIMGVAPAETGEHSTTPPRVVGGNMDCRHLRAGTQLVLPVAVSGALFSCGDGHAAQGDGEVCGTGLETSVRATLRFNVRKGEAPPSPRALVKRPLERSNNDTGYAVTTGLGSDLYNCAQAAVRDMITVLTSEHGLSRQEAYVLCSLAVDLRISELVNKPTWMVTAYLPLSVFAS